MQVDEVRVADDSDFQKFKFSCENHEGWKLDYNKGHTQVWTKKNEVSDFKMIKVRSVFPEISAPLLYDVIHDPGYRKVWDKHMIEGHDICCLNPNNDIGYYAVKSPPPLKNRDFVTQRSWLDRCGDYMIINHSVKHASCPPRKGFIRGISYLTGYFVRPKGQGCEMFYVTQCDLRGKLPAWLVNKATQLVAPKLLQKVQKAALLYENWKRDNRPYFKPWINPEQIEIPRINWDDIKSTEEESSDESLDESNISEKECTDAIIGSSAVSAALQS